jgi:hypothetical protein
LLLQTKSLFLARQMLGCMARAAKHHAVEQGRIAVVADVMQLQLIARTTSFASVLSACERHGSNSLAKLASHGSQLAPIVCLLPLRGPPAIARLAMAIVINAIEAHALGPFSDVG